MKMAWHMEAGWSAKEPSVTGLVYIEKVLESFMCIEKHTKEEM